VNDAPQNPFAEGPLKAEKAPEIRDGKRREKMLDRLRLQGFWPVYAAFIFLAMTPPGREPHRALEALHYVGLGIALLGVLVRIWSIGYLMKKAELANAGPYCRTRNPLYVGTWLIGCGFALNTAWPWNVGLFTAFNLMFFFIYRAQIALEEEMLSSIYGPAYDEYRAHVPRFFPALKAWRKGDVGAFSLTRAFRNRAWEPVLGFVVLLLLQAASWTLLWPVLLGDRSFAKAWDISFGAVWPL
jgi:protein-S-isoprenylcysteine O-methyltransferase Ste14